MTQLHLLRVAGIVAIDAVYTSRVRGKNGMDGQMMVPCSLATDFNQEGAVYAAVHKFCTRDALLCETCVHASLRQP